MSLDREIFSLREAIIRAKRKAVQEQIESSNDGQQQNSSQQQFQQECSQQQQQEQEQEQQQHKQSQQQSISHYSQQQESLSHSLTLQQQFHHSQSSQQHKYHQQLHQKQVNSSINLLVTNIYNQRRKNELIKQDKQIIQIEMRYQQKQQQRLKESLQQGSLSLSYSKTKQPVGLSFASGLTMANPQHSQPPNPASQRVFTLREQQPNSKKQKQQNHKSQNILLKSSFKLSKQYSLSNNITNLQININGNNRKLQQKQQYCYQDQNDQQQYQWYSDYIVDCYQQLGIPKLFSSIRNTVNKNRYDKYKTTATKKVNQNHSIRNYNIFELIKQWKHLKAVNTII